MVLVRIDVLPDHLAVPIHLAQRGVVAAEHTYAFLEGRGRLADVVVVADGFKILVGPGHQQVAVAQQTTVAGLDVVELPLMHHAAVDVDEAGDAAAAWCQQRIALWSKGWVDGGSARWGG